MGEGDDDARFAVHELQRLADDAESHQPLIDHTSRAEQQRPAERARDNGYEQRAEGNKQEDAAPGGPHAIEDIGFRSADQGGEQGNEERDAKCAAEDLVEIAVAENVAIVGEVVNILDALVEAEAVQR